MNCYHVVPLNDLIKHDSSSLDECICGPDIQYLEEGNKIIVHHSLDGREKDEPDYAQELG